MGPGILKGHPPTVVMRKRQQPGPRLLDCIGDHSMDDVRLQSATRSAPRLYPRPDIVEEEGDEAAIAAPTTLAGMLSAAWTHPLDNIGVVVVLLLCFMGFYFSTKGTAPAASPDLPLAELQQHSMLSLLVHEVQALRLEVAQLRAILLSKTQAVPPVV
ncbi:hypothetical protein ACHHYP_10214 [Achlya hypogyna]|uniref:Uncharacterized protein n=1 Tax=Achlya hypogyna TaxID=1202772 RepID=A0A1V9ZI20_ACHHY|nr:hypothetical protein ACHHYP_10214 [Achlya hypogyna]